MYCWQKHHGYFAEQANLYQTGADVGAPGVRGATKPEPLCKVAFLESQSDAGDAKGSLWKNEN